MRIIEGDYTSGTVVLEDVPILSIGKWRLFLRDGKNLFSLSISNNNEIKFETYEHKIMISNKNFIIDVRPHLYDINNIEVNKSENDVFISFEKMYSLEDEFDLIIENISGTKNYSYNLLREDGKLIAKIPRVELFQEFSNKRFFIKKHGKEPILYQFNLNNAVIAGPAKLFRDKYMSQIYICKFYIRKDNNLGLRVAKPRLYKIITKIEDFKLYGHIAQLKGFADAKAFFTLQDRNSLETIRVPINGNFEIDLQKLDLISLKSKDKTILDAFVEIVDKENEVIRKEKIKYRFSNYKKDTYYAHKIFMDNLNNQHHFLVTTTPFDNIKIETFTIPKEINIPVDPIVKDENVWLIGERYNTAQDNGIVLFNWLQKNTNIDAYYVMEEGTPDYDNVKENPNVLVFGSPKHYEIAFKAKVLLGTHDLENILPYKPAKGFFGYELTYRIFLQHGVLGRKNVEYHKKYYELPFNLFIVSSDPEKIDIVMEEMGYEDEEVVVTGLARFDKLIQSNEPKDILLMPTWRDWINTDQQFLESNYYAIYSSLIANEKLQKLLEQYDVNLNFYPHYRAQEYFQRNINDIPNNRVKLISLGEKTVQQLLIDHALLITDYSSVSFDFLKLNKPIIYYHFDVERFFRRGILRPIEETFIGRIAQSEKELIELIEDRMKNKFQNYDVDISGVIKYEDRNNCERIYTEIINRL